MYPYNPSLPQVRMVWVVTGVRVFRERERERERGRERARERFAI